jgi:hypothetical protein
MRRFLGCSLFFRKFVPYFSEMTAPLHDMVKKDFNWNVNTWKVDYTSHFERFKEALLNSTTLYYPDYDLEWLLRVDASEFAVGYVLIQIYVDPITSEHTHQPITFGACKFSQSALKWDIFDKEAFAQYYGVKDNEFYLRGKHFTLEGDHANHQWMEKSLVPRVIRWRIYLQGFSYSFNCISGKSNVIADWQSRLFTLNMLCNAATVDNPDIKIESDHISRNDALNKCHGGRSGHGGARRTWLLLNSKFPGHGISYSQVAEFVASCPVCQKVRLGMQDALVPVIRHLKTDRPRRVVGCDHLSMETDKNGNTGLYIIRDHFSKIVYLHPTKERNAIALATALFSFAVTYSVFDFLISDPGSEFTSETIECLNKWFGIHHRFSLVDRHESNGVEGGNKQVLRHVRALICDERIKDRWSDITVIGWITFIMNSFDDSESGMPPYTLMFGSEAARYFDFPSTSLDIKTAPKFLKQLDDDLLIVRENALRYQKALADDRTKSEIPQNMYQRGDYVLFKHPTDRPLPSKLSTAYAGPFEVVGQTKNDVECRHLITHAIKTFYVENLKLFYGTDEEAYKLAMLDSDQYEVDCFVAYRGDPMKRTTMEFLVRFRDSSEHWLPWSEDLFTTVQYEDFCRLKAPLFPLIYRVNESRRQITQLNKTPITSVAPGDQVFVDLRSYNDSWYQALKLPNCDTTTYVVVYNYLRWHKKPFSLVAHCPIFKENFNVDHLFVFRYGSIKIFDESQMILVDADFVSRYPQVLPVDYSTRR